MRISVISDANIVKIEKFLNLEIKGLSKSKSGERKDAYIKQEQVIFSC